MVIKMLSLALRRTFSKMPRKMKVKHMEYTQLPDWLKKQERDPFNYKLRSKEEVKEEHRLFPPNFDIKIVANSYPSGDVRENEKMRIDHRDKKAKIIFDLRHLQLTTQ